MLTLKEINEASFGKSNFSGYKPEDVDAFLDEIADSYKELMAEREANQKRVGELQAKNNELQEKLTVLAKKIDSYRKDEDGIKDAILSAQRVAKASLGEASEKADTIIAEANKKAQGIVDAAKGNAEREAKEFAELAEKKKYEFEEIRKSVSDFKSKLVEMYKKHIEHIDNIPNPKPLIEKKETESKILEIENISVVQDKEIKAEAPLAENAGELGKKIDFSETIIEEEAVINASSDRSAGRSSEQRVSRFRDLEFGDDIDVTNHR